MDMTRWTPWRGAAVAGAVLAAACADSGGVSPAAGTGEAGSASEVAAPALEGEWHSYRGNSASTGIATGSLGTDLALLWTFAAEAAIVSSPVVAGGRVFIGSDDHNVYALDLASGAKLWAYATEDIVEAPPLYHAGVVYVGSSDYYLYALDAESGELLWRAETDDKILGGANWLPAPTGQGTWIVVGSYDGRLYCFDAATGQRMWDYETQNFVNGTPAVLDGQIVFGGCDAALHVVDGATGEVANRVELGEACHVAGSVALADGRAYLGHHDNAFVSVDLSTGETVWSYESPRHGFFSSPAIGADRVVFGGRDKLLHCARRSDGEPLWTVRTRRKVDGSPVICGDKVVFGSGDGTLYVVALEDGSVLWSHEIGRSIFSSPAVVDGRILIGANDGVVYAFGPAAELEAAR